MSGSLLFIILVGGGLLMCSCGRPAGDWRAADWCRAADARIDRLRRGDFRVSVFDADGRPVAGTVTAELVRHRFLFGTCVNGHLFQENADGQRYRDWVLRHCNAAVDENGMKWYSTEKERGQLTWEAGDRIAAWCREHGLALRGHCLFWERDKFVKWQPWLFELKGDELRQAVTGRIDQAVPRYRDQVICWDVNNEMLDGNFFESRLPGIRAQMFRQAHALDPVPLFVNEFGILGGGEKRDRYLALVADLRRQGAPVGGIGIQEHACERFTTARQAAGRQVGETAERVEHAAVSPEAALRDLDRLGDLGLPIHLTEISCKTSDEEARAIGLETLYRVGFSHPAVNAILLWGFWAKSHWLGQNAALVDEDWQPTAAGRMLDRLLTEEWHTRVSGALGADGLAFRGFHGDYAVTVKFADGTAAPVTTVTLGPEHAAAVVRLSRPRP